MAMTTLTLIETGVDAARERYVSELLALFERALRDGDRDGIVLTTHMLGEVKSLPYGTAVTK
jgi:hypothetical protein